MLHATNSFFRLLLLLIALLVTADFESVHSQSLRMPNANDSLLFPRTMMDFKTRRKMNVSAYPVQMYVEGKVVRIHSNYSQILPIYTRNGTFYMAMKLNKGTNWLTGLPRGQYFINNRPLTIK